MHITDASGDKFEILVTDFLHWKSQQINNTVTNILKLSPSEVTNTTVDNPNITRTWPNFIPIHPQPNSNI